VKSILETNIIKCFYVGTKNCTVLINICGSAAKIISRA
jgi:hypothetical protein